MSTDGKQFNDVELITGEEEKTNQEPELTEEEKKELKIQKIKESRLNFMTNKDFGKKYKTKKKSKNKLTKASRKNNRKKK